MGDEGGAKSGDEEHNVVSEGGGVLCVDALVPMRLDIECEGVHLKDSFLWNVNGRGTRDTSSYAVDVCDVDTYARAFCTLLLRIAHTLMEHTHTHTHTLTHSLTDVHAY